MTLHVKVEAGTPTFVAGYECTPWGAGGWTINVPATVQEGDIGFIITGRDAGDAFTMTDPDGWTRVIPDTVATNSNWRILTRVRQNGDPSTITPAGANGTLVAFWYRNARLGSVGTRWIRSGTSNSITCPSLARSVTGSVLLAIGGDRSIAATAGEQGYTSVTGATYARRYEGNPTLSSGTQICATFYAEIAPAGPPSDVTWTLNDSATNAFGMQIELVPSGTWRKVSQPKLKLTNAWRDASAVFTKVNNEWREVWPGNAGAVKIIGPGYGYPAGTNGYLPYPPASNLHNVATLPGAPHYRVIGDKNRIHSARVEISWRSTQPKDAVDITAVWDFTNDWAIYHVARAVPSTYGGYGMSWYFAVMTPAEVAALVPPWYAVPVWTVRDGGFCVYMPAAWDVSGMTVPTRSGTDSNMTPPAWQDNYTGYAPFPTTISVTKNPVDGAYSIENGYSDEAWRDGVYSSGFNYTNVSITLRDVNGTVLASFAGAVNWRTPAAHVPGADIGPLSLRALREATTARSFDPGPEWYWPEEWRGLFDNADRVPWGITVQFGQTLESGINEWYVFDKDGNRIGDFRLAMKREFPDLIQIHGVNLEPTLRGMDIMHEIVNHGVRYLPTQNVIVRPPDRATYDVMRTWGWSTFEEGSPALDYAPWVAESQESKDEYLGVHQEDFRSWFPLLGYPPRDEVAK